MPPTSTASGYSPDIEIILEVNGLRLNVAELGPRYLVVRRAVTVEPAEGVVTLRIDRRPSTYRILLTHGIDSARDRQPFDLLAGPTAAEMAAEPALVHPQIQE